MKKQTKRKPVRRMHYTLLSELTASPSQPLAESARVHHLSLMWEGLRSLEIDQKPATDDWRVCSDAVNMLATFTTFNGGQWLDCAGDVVTISDGSGLLMDAITALEMSGKRHREGKRLGLDALGIQAVRAVLENYAELIETLPARTVIKAHRQTEKRIADILDRRKLPHDVEIMDL